MAGEGKQILIDIQLRNQNINKDLETLRKELEAIRKEAKALEEQDRKLWEQENKDEKVAQKLTQTITNLNKQEKALQTQIQALEKEQVKLTKEIEQQASGVAKLEAVHKDLGGFLQETSAKLTTVREAMVGLDQEEKQLASSGKATAEDFDRIQMSSIGLSKAMKQLEKDYAMEVKSMMMAANTEKELVVAEEKSTQAIKRHQTGLTQLAMYFNTAGVSARDFIWLIADMGRQFTWGAAGIGSIIGMLGGLGASMLAQTSVVKKFLESFKGTNAHLEEFKKTLGDIDWQAIKAGASLTSLFAIMQQTASLTKLTDKLKDNAVQQENLNILTKDTQKGWETTYKTIGLYGDTVESTSKKWDNLVKIGKKYNVNLSDLEKNTQNVAKAVTRVQDALNKSNNAIVKSGVAIEKAKEAEQNYIDSLKSKEKQLKDTNKAAKESLDVSRQTAEFQDYVEAHHIKLNHVQQEHFRTLIRQGKEWRGELEKIGQEYEKQIAELKQYAEGLGMILTDKETKVIGDRLKISYDEAKAYIDELSANGADALQRQAKAIKDLNSKILSYYEALKVVSKGNIQDMKKLATEEFNELLQKTEVYSQVMQKIAEEEKNANAHLLNSVTDGIRQEAQFIREEEQAADVLIRDLETIAAKEKDFNKLSTQGAKERLNALFDTYHLDLTHYDSYIRVKTAIDKKYTEQQQEELKKAAKEAWQVLGQISAQLMTVWNNYYARRIQAQDEATNAFLANLQNEKDLGLITEQDYISKVNAANWAAKKEKDRILAEQAKAQRAAGIANILMDTAQGIMKVIKDWAGMPWVMTALIALVTGLGAAQMAALLSAPVPRAEKGGEIKGPSHKQGGVMIEAEGGEYIIPKNVYARNKGMVAAMTGNSSIGGSFSGFDSILKAVMNQGDYFKEALADLKVYASIEEIRTADKNYVELTDTKI